MNTTPPIAEAWPTNAPARGRRIPVTGIGVIAPGAIGIDAFRALLASGSSAVSEIDRFDTAGLRAHKAALVRDFKAKDFIAPMKLRRMNTLSRYAVAAAKLAIDDAGAPPPAETGVALGTAFGPVQTSVDYMQEYVEKGAALAPPQLFAESVANAPGSHIAIEHGFRGFNVTVTQRESSALAAAMYAASQLVKGSARAALIGEGAAALVLQPGAEAKYGYLSGFGIARDTTASISDWGSDSAAVVAAMRAAIDDAELAPADIDAIYASANATRKADALEAHAIDELFGQRPVVATKGCFGEYAAGGALQLTAALLAIADQTLHGSCGFEAADEGARIDVVRATRPAALRHVLVNSLSAGGGIVCAVVSREAA